MYAPRHEPRRLRPPARTRHAVSRRCTGVARLDMVWLGGSPPLTRQRIARARTVRARGAALAAAFPCAIHKRRRALPRHDVVSARSAAAASLRRARAAPDRRDRADEGGGRRKVDMGERHPTPRARPALQYLRAHPVPRRRAATPFSPLHVRSETSCVREQQEHTGRGCGLRSNYKR